MEKQAATTQGNSFFRSKRVKLSLNLFVVRRDNAGRQQGF
jgi:hypothetical protein